MKDADVEAPSPRASTSKTTLLLLWLFLGLFGAHRYYTGKFFTGLLMTLSTGGLGVWWIVDLFLILAGEFTDWKGRRVTSW
jgi:TM2 domain-containing membrane protein YozV